MLASQEWRSDKDTFCMSAAFECEEYMWQVPSLSQNATGVRCGYSMSPVARPAQLDGHLHLQPESAVPESI